MASVTTFSAGEIPVPEVASFYSLDNILLFIYFFLNCIWLKKHAVPPADRPYVWTMSVSTLDGFLSFKDPEAHGPSQVAMAHIKDSGSIAGMFRFLFLK